MAEDNGARANGWTLRLGAALRREPEGPVPAVEARFATAGAPARSCSRAGHGWSALAGAPAPAAGAGVRPTAATTRSGSVTTTGVQVRVHLTEERPTITAI